MDQDYESTDSSARLDQPESPIERSDGLRSRWNIFRSTSDLVGIAISTSGVLTVRLVGMALSLLVAVFLARTLGPEQYGIYGYVLSIVSIVVIGTSFGLPVLLVREFAANTSRGRPDLTRGLLRRSNEIAAALSTTVAVAMVLIAVLALPPTSSDLSSTLMWGAVLVPLLTLAALRGGALRGLGYVATGFMPEAVIRPIVMLFLLGAAHILGNALGSSEAMALNVLAASIAFGLGAVLLSAVLRARVPAASRKYNTRQWLRSGLPLALVAGVQVLNTNTDIIMLGSLTTATDVGIYRIATSAVGLVLFPVVSVGFAIGPVLAGLHAKGEKGRFSRLYWTGGAIATGTTAVGLIGILLAGRFLIALVFGSDYLSAYDPLVILAFGIVVSAATGPAWAALSMTGFEKQALVIIAATVMANIVANAALIPQFGIIGAAVATTGNRIAMHLLLMWRCSRLGIIRRPTVRGAT